jgi:type II secretory pathway component PulC
LGIAVAALALYTFVFRPQPEINGVSAVAAAATGAKAKAKAKVVQPAPAAKVEVAQPADTTGALTPKILLPETWGTDPFVRDWVMVNELANLKLKAITLGGDRPYALINDQILQAGDEISGKRIVKIESDNVTLEQGGRTFTLLLGE